RSARALRSARIFPCHSGEAKSLASRETESQSRSIAWSRSTSDILSISDDSIIRPNLAVFVLQSKLTPFFSPGDASKKMRTDPSAVDTLKRQTPSLEQGTHGGCNRIGSWKL